MKTEHKSLVDRFKKIEGWLRRGCDCEYDYRCGRCDAIISMKEIVPEVVDYIERLEEALKPFAAMHREGSDPNELACERGAASDKTIITSKDFLRANNILWGERDARIALDCKESHDD